MDLMTFDEKTMELNAHDGNKDHNLILTELQASVTEAANVIEHEIKGESITWAQLTNLFNSVLVQKWQKV